MTQQANGHYSGPILIASEESGIPADGLEAFYDDEINLGIEAAKAGLCPHCRTAAALTPTSITCGDPGCFTWFTSALEYWDQAVIREVRALCQPGPAIYAIPASQGRISDSTLAAALAGTLVLLGVGMVVTSPVWLTAVMGWR